MAPVLRIVFLCVAACLAAVPPIVLSSGAAQAQAIDAPEYDAWRGTVERAEGTIDRGRASDEALEDLRRELDDWRATFTDAQEINASRIRTALAQLEALGPAPEEGETEADTVAEVRKELNVRLDELTVPRRTAEVAFNRADSLISEIDQIIRSRQARDLLTVTDSPVLPGVWARALREILRTDRSFANEIRRSWASSAQRELLSDRLPIIIALFVVGGVLVVLGRRWAERTALKLQARDPGAGSQLAAFTVSLGQIAVPLVGLTLIVVGLSFTGMGGTLTETILTAALGAGFAMLLGRWLATRTFPKTDTVPGPIPLDAPERKRGRAYTTTLGVVLGLRVIIDAVAEIAGFSASTSGLLNLPLILLGAFMLFRMSRLFREAVAATGGADQMPEDSESGFMTRVLWLLSRALFAISLAAVFFAIVGYGTLAVFLTYPPMLSMALIGVISILHLVFKDAYALITRRSVEQAREALVPVLMTFALALASIPLFAMIWGARWSDITETWSWLSEGFALGDTQIGPQDVLTIAVVFAFGYGLTRLLQATLKTAVLPRTRLDTGGQNAITAGVGYVGITIAAILAITIAGVDLTGFALIASALSVGIGFGLQTIVSNFVSGLILLAERPISEGDWIEVAGQMGIVKEISVRATTIETFDRTDVIVPNGDLVAGIVTNWTRGNTIGRVIVSVGVAYHSDSDQVAAILREECEAHPMVSMNPEPRIFFRRFGADALEFDCFCILRDVNFKLQVHSELNHAIHKRFREEGIEIPFAQRDVWLRNPETLRGPRPDAEGEQTA